MNRLKSSAAWVRESHTGSLGEEWSLEEAACFGGTSVGQQSLSRRLRCPDVPHTSAYAADTKPCEEAMWRHRRCFENRCELRSLLLDRGVRAHPHHSAARLGPLQVHDVNDPRDNNRAVLVHEGRALRRIREDKEIGPRGVDAARANSHLSQASPQESCCLRGL